MHEIKAGSTDQTIRFMLTKSDGTPYTGLVHSTPGLKCYYSRQGAASAEIVLVDIPAIGTYVSSGFKAVDGTNMPGYYELGIPDAAIAAGARFVDIMISGPADLYVCPQRIRLTGIDLDDAASAGLSKVAALPASPAAVGSPMTLEDSAITNAKIANGAITFENASVLVAGFEPAIDYTELADGIWGATIVHGGDTASNKLHSAFTKTANLPASPAAVGSPMTLADGAISFAKVADGALTSAKVTSVGAVVGNIGGSVNNIVEGVDLSTTALDSIWGHTTRSLTDDVTLSAAVLDQIEQAVGDSADEALGSVAADISALNTLVARMMGPGDTLFEFPVFDGPSPSTTPLEGVTVWITTDEDGADIYAGPQLSDAAGKTRWMITTGVSFYVWCQMAGRTFTNPVEVNI